MVGGQTELATRRQWGDNIQRKNELEFIEHHSNKLHPPPEKFIQLTIEYAAKMAERDRQRRAAEAMIDLEFFNHLGGLL